MSSLFGKILQVGVFGESHGAGIGAFIDGLPAGEKIDLDELKKFMARRAPGNAPYATKRKEADDFEFLSGILDGVTCGTPVCAVIRNTSTRSEDYENVKNVPRPSHADLSAEARYGGFQDKRGGGHFSGRLTAPLCLAGGIALQILAKRGIVIGAHLASVGSVSDKSFDPVHVLSDDLAETGKKSFPVIDDVAGEKMKEVISLAASKGDSVGGVIECGIVNFPCGIGSPMFDGIENRLSSALFGIPAVKGIEFGNGFAATTLNGSRNNDPWCVKDGKIVSETNNHGGILGGISTGMPIIFRAAFKPTPSIALSQKSVDLETMKETVLEIRGRHDPCIAPRAVPVVEAVTALVLLDLYLESGRK